MPALTPVRVKYAEIGAALEDQIAPVLDALPLPVAVAACYTYLLVRMAGTIPPTPLIDAFIKESTELLNLHASIGGPAC